MTLIKTSLLNAIAVLVRLLTLLGINKLLAIYVGPLGYAALGQFQNAITMITTFASGAINTGVTKYTAEYFEDEERQRTLWQTAGSVALLGSLVTAVLIFNYRNFLSRWFLQSEAYASVFIWFAVSLTFFIFNALLLAILNGKKEISSYVMANISGSVFALGITAILIVQWGLYGALIALAIFQSLAFWVSLFLCYRSNWFKLSYLFGRLDKTALKKLFGYTLMAASTAVSVPISHIAIRNHLGITFGWDAAGYWEAMWRLSSAYLMLVTVTLSAYYLPRISELKTIVELKAEIRQGYTIILPLVICCALLIYLLRDFIISVLFSYKFYAVRELFLGQVIGDILKIGSWILAFTMLGKAMTKTFIFTEVLFSASFYCLVLFMTRYYGLEGVSWAYAINYFLYWITMYCLIFGRSFCNSVVLK